MSKLAFFLKKPIFPGARQIPASHGLIGSYYFV